MLINTVLFSGGDFYMVELFKTSIACFGRDNEACFEMSGSALGHRWIIHKGKFIAIIKGIEGENV